MDKAEGGIAPTALSHQQVYGFVLRRFPLTMFPLLLHAYPFLRFHTFDKGHDVLSQHGVIIAAL